MRRDSVNVHATVLRNTAVAREVVVTEVVAIEAQASAVENEPEITYQLCRFS